MAAHSFPLLGITAAQHFVSHQIARFDLDGLFSNVESVHQVSAKLLSLLEEATADVEPSMQVIGMFAVFSELCRAAWNNDNAIKLPFPIPSPHPLPSCFFLQ